MKIGQKLLSVLLALVIACSLMVTSVWAANGERYSVSATAVTSHNQAVETKKQELQDLYGIAISYPTYDLNGTDVAAIYPETLETLETALSYVTPYVVRQVSAYYYDLNSKRLRFTYRFADLAGGQGDSVERGGFDPDEGLIVLLIARPGRGASTSGDEPLTIVHELGHAVHVMIERKYGESALEQEWKAYNQGHSYIASNIESNPSETVFVSGYAATDYHEDVAETFAHVFVRNRSGMGFSNKMSTNGTTTGLGKKVQKLESLLHTYFPDSTTMQENYRKIYTVANSANYKGVTVRGERLQFMGYVEPRYMPYFTLTELGVSESSYTWLKALGAWVAPTSSGYTIMFPDGSWGTTTINILA